MSDHVPPRSPRTGGPRRPSGHRARPGGSARAVPRRPPPEDGPPAAGPAPTRPLPRTSAPSPGTPSPVPRIPSPLPRGEGRTERGTAARRPGRGEDHGQGRWGGGGAGAASRSAGRSAHPNAGAHAVRPAPDGGGPPRGDAPLRRSRGPRPRVPRRLRLAATLMVLVLVVVLGWGTGLLLWSDSRIEHVEALSGAPNTPGTTYLIAGSDRREGEAVADDGTQGARADTMMLLHRAPGGNSYLISLPRDTLVDVPGHGGYKLNAAYAFGGAPLLVETVEQFTGLTVDHYVEVGFDGVSQVVDAVGHVNLCIDQDVDDRRSGLTMTEGCHDVGGEQALAFVRARYFDPTADIGRQGRQQQFVGALMDRVTSPAVLLNPLAQVRLAGAGSGALVTSERTGIIDVGRMGLTARSAMSSGGTLAIPIEDPQYPTAHSGIAVLTDEEDIAAFFAAVGDGSAEIPAST